MPALGSPERAPRRPIWRRGGQGRRPGPRAQFPLCCRRRRRRPRSHSPAAAGRSRCTGSRQGRSDQRRERGARVPWAWRMPWTAPPRLRVIPTALRGSPPGVPVLPHHGACIIGVAYAVEPADEARRRASSTSWMRRARARAWRSFAPRSYSAPPKCCGAGAIGEPYNTTAPAPEEPRAAGGAARLRPRGSMSMELPPKAGAAAAARRKPADGATRRRRSCKALTPGRRATSTRTPSAERGQGPIASPEPRQTAAIARQGCSPARSGKRPLQPARLPWRRLSLRSGVPRPCSHSRWGAGCRRRRRCCLGS